MPTPLYLQDNRPVGDLYSPIFRVAFLNYSGDPVELDRFAAGEVSTDLLRRDLEQFRGVYSSSVGIFHALSNYGNRTLEPIEDLVLRVNASFSAESRVGAPFKFTLTMTPEYEDGIKLLNSRLLGYATVVRVEWGYVTGDGREILSNRCLFRSIYPKATFGQDIQIVLSGHDIVTDVTMRRSANRVWKADHYLSPFGIIQALTEERIEPYRIDKRQAKLEIGSGHKVFLPIKEDIQQHLTDWAFILYLLRQYGLSIVIRGGNEIYIYDPVRPSKDINRTYIFKWRRSLTSPYDVPVYSLDANYLNAMFNPPASRGLLALKVDNETGEISANELDATSTSSSTPTTDKSKSLPEDLAVFKSAPKIAAKDTDSEVTAEPKKDSKTGEIGTQLSKPFEEWTGNNDVDEHYKSVVKEAQVLGSPIVKIKCPGLVDLFPGDLVELQGASDVFDAVYRVLFVRHSINTSGYDMDVEMIRWSLKRSDGTPTASTYNAPTGSAAKQPKPEEGGPGAIPTKRKIG